MVSARQSMKEKSAAILREAAAAKQAREEASPSPALLAGKRPEPKTAPGGMMAFMVERKEFERQIQDLEVGNEELQAKLRSFEGGELVYQLDPNLIDASLWANRDEVNFSEDNAEFKALKDEIQNAGGNVQPIKVRRKGERFEVVFGHRRLQACRELGLQVVAIVDDLDDRQLFVQMDRENRARKNLSPFEQGEMYRKALEKKLFTSQNHMAKEIGVPQGIISRAIQLATLPEEVVAAFPSKLEIQFRFGPVLTQALQERRDHVVAKARELAGLKDKPAANHVLKLLVSEEGDGGGNSVVNDLVSVARAKNGAISLKFSKAIKESQEKKILDFIAKVLAD